MKSLGINVQFCVRPLNKRILYLLPKISKISVFVRTDNSPMKIIMYQFLDLVVDNICKVRILVRGFISFGQHTISRDKAWKLFWQLQCASNDAN